MNTRENTMIVQTETLSYESLPKASSKKIYKGNMGESCQSLLNDICIASHV